MESITIPSTKVSFVVNIDFSFRFQHFKNFMAKQLFKRTGIRRWAYPEGGIVVKSAIGGQHVQMGIEFLEITKTLDGNGRAGFGVVIGCGLDQTVAISSPGTA
jgi:hypothetical protein